MAKKGIISELLEKKHSQTKNNQLLIHWKKYEPTIYETIIIYRYV